MTLKKYIKKVATGPKGNSDLTLEEASDMMKLLLSDDVSDVEKASFLVGWRLKPETNLEYKGALKSIYDLSKKTIVEKSFELGFPFDGKNDSPYLFPHTAKFLSKVGVRLVITGCERIPAKDGLTTRVVVEELKKNGMLLDFHYFDRKDYLPNLTKLSEMRNQIGLRTALNTLEKFSKVAQSQYGASGVFHKPYVNKYADIFKEELTRFMLIAGNEGTPELCKKSKVWIVENDEMNEFLVDPEEFGIFPENFLEDTKEEEKIKCILEPTENQLKLARLNAALYLLVINKESNLKDNYNLLME